MKKQLLVLVSGILVLGGCSKPSNEPTASASPKETPTVSVEPEVSPSPEAVTTPVPEAPVVPKPYEDTIFTIVDETAVSPTYKDRAPGMDEMVDVNRFADFIEVISTEVGADGYTHFVLKDTRTDSEVKFAVLTNLPDLEVFITGGTANESERMFVQLLFRFNEELQEKMRKGECSGEKYGLSYYKNQFAFMFGTEFAEYWISEDYDSGQPIKGANVIETQGKYSLVTGDIMYGLTDSMLEGNELTEEDKAGLRALLELPALVKFD